jgi:hypothetical protein
MRAFRARCVAVGFGVGFAVVVAGVAPCVAQLSEGPGGGSSPNSISSAANRNLRGAQGAAAKPEPAPPPVLPGTKVAPEAAAPTESSANMTPTDALFDAINRGDLTAARDAVNRGAELGAHNMLGFTPLDLSVDLGRNDISFMLLSQRGDDGASRRAAAAASDTGGVDLTGGTARRAAVRSRATAVSIREPAEEAPVMTPRLYSGNGGSPIPAAGFLGFDARAGR